MLQEQDSEINVVYVKQKQKKKNSGHMPYEPIKMKLGHITTTSLQSSVKQKLSY